MTGPEHYVEAERLIGGFYNEKDVQQALVHAVLALAAATAISGDTAEYAELRAWTEVAGGASQQQS